MKIAKLISDIDGTVTDGKLYLGPNGYEMKCFQQNIGEAIHLLRKMNIDFEFITSGKRGWQITQQFSNMFEIKTTLLPNLDRRIEYVTNKYLKYLENPDGYFVYVGDSDWDAQVIYELANLEEYQEDTLISYCPRSGTPSMQLASNVLKSANDDFFYHLIYLLSIKEN